MSDIGKIKIPTTRTGDARKIQEWSIRLPGGGKATFDIHLQPDAENMVFIASSSDVMFDKVRVADSDLNVLRDKLQDRVDDVVKNKVSEDWIPAVVLEARPTRNNRHEPHIACFEVKLLPVEVKARTVVGNRGETLVRDDWRSETIIQRDHEDDFNSMRPKSGSLMDPEVKEYLSSPFRNETDARTSRVVVPGDGSEPQILLDTLNRFSAYLASRLSWQQTSSMGLMKPDELVDIMQMAITPNKGG